MNWVFRPSHSNFISLSTVNDGEFVFSFKTRLNFSGEEGDRVLLIGSEGEGLHFEFTSQIVSIKSTAFDEQKLRKYTVRLSELKSIKTPNKLADLLYSLHKVYNYNKPQIHFSRVYSRLTNDDFEVIANGKIFIARTAFGKLVNSLHRQHRISFVQMLIERNPNIYFTSRKYDEVFDLLKEYIETRILIFAKFLSDSWNILQIINPDNNNQIAFAESIDKRRDLISQQIEAINIINELNAKDKFYLKLDSVVREYRETERVFIHKFSRKPLPISI